MKKKSISLFFLQRNNSRYLLQYFIKRNYLEYINNKKNNISPFLLLPPPPLIIEVFVYFFVNKLLRKKNHFFKELLTNVDQRVKINVLLLALDLFWKRNLKNYNYYCNNMFLKKSKLMKMEKRFGEDMNC